ncbi:MAG: DUF58 domain-containing protein [Planctomycetota bacterium]
MVVREHDRLIDRFDPKVMSLLLSLDLKARYLVEGFLHGLHKSPFHGISVEFSEYRDYQPGDDLRHLDWQLYARSNRLCVKKYTQETNVRIYLVIDSSGSMKYQGSDAWGSKLDVAVTVAAALTSMTLKQNDAVGLLTLDEGATGSEFIRPSQKPSQFGLMLGHLQEIRPAGGPRLAELLKHMLRLIHRRSIVLFFSDLLEDAEGIRDTFQQLKFMGHECLIFQVLDRDEIEFPFDRSSVFSDLETGDRRNVDPKAARENYLKRFHAFLAEYKELFQSLEMPHCVIRTDQEPWEALSLFLHERQRMM